MGWDDQIIPTSESVRILYYDLEINNDAFRATRGLRRLLLPVQALLLGHGITSIRNNGKNSMEIKWEIQIPSFLAWEFSTTW